MKKFRKFEVTGIDGNLFDRLKKQANKEGIAVDILIHRYLAYCLSHNHEVNREFYKPISRPKEVFNYD